MVIDPDRLAVSNLPRVVGSRPRDALALLTAEARPRWLCRLGERVATRKVRTAQRVALAANPKITFTGLCASVVDADVADLLVDCDHIFLAADSMQPGCCSTQSYTST